MSGFTAVGLSFFLSQMSGIIVPISQGYGEA